MNSRTKRTGALWRLYERLRKEAPDTLESATTDEAKPINRCRTIRHLDPRLIAELIHGADLPDLAEPQPGKPSACVEPALDVLLSVVYSEWKRRASSSERARDLRLARFLAAPLSTVILTRLIEQSAAPMAKIEDPFGEFVVGSTQPSCAAFDLASYRQHGERARSSWVKLHVAIGTQTGVITAVKVSMTGPDAPVLPDLVAATASNFAIKDVIASAAYLCVMNVEAIANIGATAWIPFRPMSRRAHSSQPWREMWIRFALDPEEFVRRGRRTWPRLHATIRAIEAMARGLRSRTPVARVNELLLLVLLHNLSRLVRAIEERRIDIKVPAPVVDDS